ncbi:LOW QUALITY PROTEIN: hypothetical protein U9M48_017348 [Paspalum notatum var. saurae]|uniref:Uncharacterized protein n=1 Tax=Paspalum notatum var. saurae TaxID=547442 RepID=A0AAQ3T975_PASNO
MHSKSTKTYVKPQDKFETRQLSQKTAPPDLCFKSSFGSQYIKEPRQLFCQTCLDVEAELSPLLGGVELVLPRRRQQLEVLYEAADGDAEDGQREDDAGAAPAADAEGQVPEVVAVGLHVLLLLEEALGAELLGPPPALGVVGEVPGVDQDLALGGDVVAAELGVVEVHVRHQQRDGHAQPQRLLDHRLQGRLCVSGSVIWCPGPSTASSSCRSFCWISGWFTSSAIAHSIDHSVVSIAADRAETKQSRTNELLIN